MLLTRIASSFAIILTLCACTSQALHAQSIAPMIAEYTDHASGSFDVTNSSLYPAIVQLDPKSFSIAVDGTGQFRPLDPNIHLELSATSMRLAPRQTAHVFYKASADNVPAWLCVYASFTSIQKNPGLNVRILLPHTIYLYQRAALQRDAISVGAVKYDLEHHLLTCELTNNSTLAGRASSVEVTGKGGSASQGGFPMLPHEKRLLSIEWTANQPPKDLQIEFPHFSMKIPVDHISE